MDNELIFKYNNKIMNKKTLSSSIDFSTGSDKRPHIKIEIFGESYNALLDTGASISVFGKGAENLCQLSRNISSHRVINIKIANGEIVNHEKVKMIPIQFKHEVYNIEVAFSSKIAIPVVLGINFFHTFNFEIIKKHIKSFENSKIDDILNLCALENVEEKHEISQFHHQKLNKILQKFLFNDCDQLGCQQLISHKIETGESDPIVQHQYSYNPLVLAKVHTVIDKWLEQGVIQKSNSNWRNPIVVVSKPDGDVRVCLDARKLNNITKKDRYLPPHIFEALTSIPTDVKVFGRLDKNQAFLQTPLHADDMEKTAFYVKGRGLFHFIRMPFGLTNAPATQTRLMVLIFGNLAPYVLVYFDDIIIMGRDFDHFLFLLDEVATRLRNANLTISRNKMSLFLKKITVLGHVVSSEGITIDQKRLSCIKDWPVPTTKKELQRFLGLCNWYRRHIANYSHISTPLTELTKGKIFTWNIEAASAFEKLKSSLTSPNLLQTPRWDLPMILLCDASDIGVGAALTQKMENGEERVIEFFSAKLNDNEKKYSPTEKECLAVIKAIIHFRPYIELTELIIITDHHSLKYLLNMKVTSGRLSRWILFLQPYVNCIHHRSGSLMKVPDALSRAPILSNENDGMENLFSMNDNDLWYDVLFANILQNPVKFPCHKIINEKIFQKLSFKRNLNNDDWRLIPKPKLINQIIQKCHEETLHGGTSKTLHLIQQEYTWPHMRFSVSKWISSCIKCACVKASNIKLAGPMYLSRIPKEVMTMLSIDVKGPLPQGGRQRYKYIIVMMDLLSRYAWIKLCHSVTSKILTVFMNEIFNQQGYPREIIHDNASQFTSDEFQKFLVDKNITSHNIPIYTAKNNPVERLNRSIGEAISLCLMDFPDQHKKWVNYINGIVEKLNNRWNEATQFSPFHVFFGFPSSKGEMLIRRGDEQHRLLMKQAYENSMKKFSYNRLQYNKDKSIREFTANDVIMVKTHKQSNLSKDFNAKLEPKYQPALVVENSFANAYLVKLPNGRNVVVDLNDIKSISKELQEIILHYEFSQ